MLKLREGIKILVSMEPVDARKSINSLSCLIPDKFCDNPQSGNLFLFFNKARDKVKILYWDHNGFVLHYKRLEKHRFKVPKLTGLSQIEITEAQLYGLLAGLDFMLMRQFNEINYYQYALEEYIKAQQLRQFANKSEKVSPDQLQFFDKARPIKDEEKLLAAEEEIQVANFTRKKSPGRKALPADLPRVARIYDLEEAEKVCACGCELTYISDEKVSN